MNEKQAKCPLIKTNEAKTKFYMFQDVKVEAMVLSAQFWPSFREEKLALPEEMQKLLEKYTKQFEAQKGNRTLNWKSHLGMTEYSNILHTFMKLS